MMSKWNKKGSDSELNAQLKALRLTADERKAAIHALNLGESIVDAILGFLEGGKRLFAGVALKPSLKH
jgi:hypothetical protein